jgi:hypothetical protein
VTITQLHIRVEHSTQHLTPSPYALGVVLSELAINTPDVDGAVRVEEEYAGLPVAIRGFGVYVNTTVEAAADQTAGMGAPFTKPASGQLTYVLHPLTATVQTQLLCSLLGREDETPRVRLDLAFEALQVCLSHPQYVGLMDLLEKVSQNGAALSTESSTAQANAFRHGTTAEEESYRPLYQATLNAEVIGVASLTTAQEQTKTGLERSIAQEDLSAWRLSAIVDLRDQLTRLAEETRQPRLAVAQRTQVASGKVWVLACVMVCMLSANVAWLQSSLLSLVLGVASLASLAFAIRETLRSLTPYPLEPMEAVVHPPHLSLAMTATLQAQGSTVTLVSCMALALRSLRVQVGVKRDGAMTVAAQVERLTSDQDVALDVRSPPLVEYRQLLAADNITFGPNIPPNSCFVCLPLFLPICVHM